jgi:hypothetical protein
MADLYEKTNTDVKTAIKVVTEESSWFRSYPREQITVSGNENRVPLVLTQPIHPAMLPDGGYERIMSTPAPTHGTFTMTQMNVRYGYTGLAQALTNRARGAMIEEQTAFQAMMAGYSIGRGVGLQTYGSSTGTIAVVKTTGASSATQVIPIKNAFGSSTFVAGGDVGVQDTFLSNLPRVGDHIALIRASAIVEFGAVTASPSASSGVGYVDVTFTSAITPTVGDLVVLANADIDSTIAGTDVNNWMIGWTEILTAASVLGVATSSFPAWAPGSTSTASQRYSFAVKEKMINDCKNASGMKINRFIIGQGVVRDSISGQLGSRRYEGSEVDLEGSLKPGDGEKNFTSQLALPNTVIGWYDQSVRKIELSDLPEDGSASKSIFKLDKVQNKSAVAASYDYFAQKVPSSRAATGYATNLTSS